MRELTEDELRELKTPGPIEYTLLLEDDCSADQPLVYWGYAVYHCNFIDAKYPSQNFVIMYARVTSFVYSSLYSEFVIGTAVRDRKRGEPIIWNPKESTRDVKIEDGGVLGNFLQDPGLPPNVFVTRNNPEDLE